MLLYVFGIKMHERYLFPALFLLGMTLLLAAAVVVAANAVSIPIAARCYAAREKR